FHLGIGNLVALHELLVKLLVGARVVAMLRQVEIELVGDLHVFNRRQGTAVGAPNGTLSLPRWLAERDRLGPRIGHRGRGLGHWRLGEFRQLFGFGTATGSDHSECNRYSS